MQNIVLDLEKYVKVISDSLATRIDCNLHIRNALPSVSSITRNDGVQAYCCSGSARILTSMYASRKLAKSA